MDDNAKALQYYKCGLRGIPPPFIPKQVLVLGTVHGDGPFVSTHIGSGIYECHSNKYGAISVRATNGSMLGLKPKEFEVVEWAENPHRIEVQEASHD
jgi:hypothetical protein